MHKGRIYISSTYKDLEAEREKVHSTIRRLNYDAGRMEDMVASDTRPLDKCLTDVQSCDIYIGIIGWRYGFIPEHHGLSITELEYEEAGRCKIPRLIFLLKRDSSKLRLSALHGFSARRLAQYYSQSPKTRKKLTQFRERARRECVVDFFSSLGELEGKVATALSRLADDLKIGVRRNEVPHLLPYLSDRGEQNLLLKKELRNQNVTKPFLCVIHGQQREAHHKYLEYINKFLLTTTLTNRKERNLIASESIQWPSISVDPNERFEMLLQTQLERLFQRLGLESHSKQSYENSSEWMEEIPAFNQTTTIDDTVLFTQSIVSKYRMPIMLESHIHASEWQDHEIVLIRRWFDFWSRLSLPIPTFVFLALHYLDMSQNPTQRDRLVRKNQKIRGEIESLPLTPLKVVILPELKPITRTDAIEWASPRGKGGEWLDKQGCEPYDSQYLINRIHEIYNEEMETMTENQAENMKITIPMASLGAKLKYLLLPCTKHRIPYVSSVSR